MSSILRFKRGTTAELASLTESIGEIVIDTTKKTVVVMDGATAGGTPLATTRVATASQAGLMSVADKSKLDGLSQYVLPVATTTALGGVKVDGTTVTINNGVISAVTTGGTGGVSQTTVDTTIATALQGYYTSAEVDQKFADAAATGGVDLTPYLNKTTTSDNIVAGRTVLQRGYSIIPAGAVASNTNADYPNARTYIRGAAPGTRRYDSTGAMIMDGANPANFGSQIDFAFQRYGQNADGSIDMATTEEIGWFGLANWNRNITFSSSRDGESSGVSYMEFLRDTGRLRLRGTDTELYVGAKTDGAGGRVDGNGFVFSNNVASDAAILAGARTYYAGRGDGLTNIPWTALVDVPADLGGTGAGTDLTTASVGALQDVDLTTAPTAGQALVWNGTAFAPADVSGGSVDLTNYYTKTQSDATYGRLAQLNVWQQRQTFRSKIVGKSKYDNGPYDGMNLAELMILQSDPGQGLVFSPLFINDLGFGTFTGRVANPVVTSTAAGAATSISAQDFADLFDTSAGSVWSLNNGVNFPTADDTVTLEFEITQPLQWSATIGVQFQGNGFAPSYGKLEAYNAKIDTTTGNPIGWEIVQETDTLLGGGQHNSSNYLAGQVGTDASGITAIRLTMKTTKTTDVRVASIFAVEANSKMGKTLFMARDGGEMYGDTTFVNSTVRVNGGDLNVYNGGAINLNGVPVATTADVTAAIDAASIAAGGGVTTFAALTDVDTTGITVGGIMKWDGSKWIAATDNEGTGGGVDQATVDSTVSTALADYSTTAEMNTAITTAVAGVSGGGSGASVVRSTRTLTANGVGSMFVLEGLGAQADIDAVTVAINATGNAITISGVASGLELTAIRYNQATNTNAASNITFTWPDKFGGADLDTIAYPSFIHFNAAGAQQATTAWTVSTTGGINTVNKTGLVANQQFRFVITL